MDTFTDILRKYFVWDITATFRAIPPLLLVLLIAAFVVGMALFFLRYECKKATRMTAGLLLVEYIILFFSSTIVLRNGLSSFGHNFTPFWSYMAIFEGQAGLAVDNVMNIAAFLPIGFLLGCAIKGIKCWKVALVACGCSIVIETSQLLLSRGFSELDDVFNNTVGALLGCGLYCIIKKIKDGISKRSLASL